MNTPSPTSLIPALKEVEARLWDEIDPDCPCDTCLTFGNDAEAVQAARAEIEQLRARAEAAKGALKEAHEFAVMFLAFIGRDQGTNRLAKTLDSLTVLARTVDDRSRSLAQGVEHG